MKIVQAMLRHSSITVTMDTCTTVLPEIALAAAEATVKLISRNPARQLGLVSGADQTTMDTKEVEERRPNSTKPHVIETENVGFGCAPSGTRTPNPLVKSQLLCQLS